MFLVLWMQFFAQAGFPCPALRNPSDHFLRCVNSDFDKVRATLKGSMKLRVLKHLLPFELLSNLTCWSSCYSTSQFEASDDPLEKITTTEAIIRLLVDYYHTSDYYYTTKAKVEEISSQYVSTLCSVLEVLLVYCNPFQRYRKGLFLTLEAARLVSFSRPTL